MHRGLAYFLFILVAFWFVRAGKSTRENAVPRLHSWRWWPLLLVLAQVLLGIFTVLNGDHTVTAGHFGSFELLALCHQLVATALLAALVANLFLTSKRGAAVKVL